MRHELIVFAIALGISTNAYAYLDPATGSMLLQLTLAGIAATIVTAKVYWSKLKAMFRKGDRKDEDATG